MRATARELGTLGVPGLDDERIPSWIKRWPLSGTVLDDAHATLKRPTFARATQRVFLAGDYLAMTPGWGYGLGDAVSSGRATGRLVSALLESER